jgi:hypothetical protein
LCNVSNAIISTARLTDESAHPEFSSEQSRYMETPNASSLPRADPGRIPTQPEGQFSSDSHYEESVPSLNRAQPHPLGGKITAHKTTVGTIVGLYLVGTLKYQPIEVDFANTATALLCSILHYIFFDRLHGSIASGEHARISQSQTTFISLLLVTIFKASLLGSVGICSVQYLWRVLRGQPIVLSRVENLFQMRHNPLELFYCHTFISVSFLLAAYTWIVPLATIYPPSALTISATPSLSTESVHLPVPQLVFDSNFNPSVPENVSRIAQFAYVNHEKYSWNNDETISGKVNLSTNLQVLNPQPLLLRLSESVIAAGEVVLNPPATITENSTYMLKFMGPQLSCRNVELFNQTVFDEGGFTDFALGKPALSRYPAETAVGTSAMNEAYMMNGNYEWQIFQQNAIGDALCQDPHENSPASDRFAALLRGDNRSLIHELLTDRFLLETSRTNCTERYVNYILNITYTKGVRSLQYTTHNIEPQPAKDLSIMMVWEAASDVVLPGYGQPRNATIDAMFAASPYFQRSREYLEEKFRYWNAFTIYAAFLDTIESATYRECSTRQMGPKCNIEWTRSNGASAAYGPMRCFSRVESKCY